MSQHSACMVPPVSGVGSAKAAAKPKLAITKLLNFFIGRREVAKADYKTDYGLNLALAEFYAGRQVMASAR